MDQNNNSPMPISPDPNNNPVGIGGDNKNSSQENEFPKGNPFSEGTDLNNNNQQQNSNDNNNIPSPPSESEKVGIRTMKSDLESIKDSGGEAPKPEIVDAPKVPEIKNNVNFSEDNLSNNKQISEEHNQNDFTNQQTNFTGKVERQESASNIPPTSPTPPTSNKIPEMPEINNNKNINNENGIQKSNSLKTTLIIAGIVIAALIVGFGIYWLVSSLNEPAPVIPQKQNNQEELPININNNKATTTSTTTEENSKQQSENNNKQENIIVHKSFLNNKDESVNVFLKEISLESFKDALNSKLNPPLDIGKVREIVFNKLLENSSSTASSTASSTTIVDSGSFLSLYFPDLPDNFYTLFEKDFTSWIYFEGKDKTPRFGAIFKLLDSNSLENASSTFKNIELYPKDIINVFAQKINIPEKLSFNNGIAGGLNVRFSVVSKGNVFEYGWLKKSGNIYLILTTSYKQMVDVLNRI